MNSTADNAVHGVRIHAIGGPTAILEIAGLRLVADPTFDEPGEYVMGSGRVLVKTASPALRPEQIGPVDAVLLSHDQHVDNLDRAGREYLAQVPLVLTTASAAERLAGACQAVAAWDHVELSRPGGGTLRVTRVPALHGPEGTEHIVGEVAGFVLSGEGVPTVYVSGDNASVDIVREIAELSGRIDVAILFAGAAKTALVDGYLTLTSTQAAEAAQILDAAQVIPLHFNSWRHFTEGGEDLSRAFAEADLGERLILLAPGESSIAVGR